MEIRKLKQKIKELEGRPVSLYWRDIRSHSFWTDHPQGYNPTKVITQGFCVGVTDEDDSLAIASTLCNDGMWSDFNVIPLALIQDVKPIKMNGELALLVKEWLEK
jgi:hypothetical protein